MRSATFETPLLRCCGICPQSRCLVQEVDVPYVVLVYPAATFCDLLRTQALWRTLEEASRLHPGWAVCLLLPELRKYIKQRWVLGHSGGSRAMGAHWFASRFAVATRQG
jgi:hypothetical protein